MKSRLTLAYLLLAMLATPLLAAELTSPHLVADFRPGSEPETVSPSKIDTVGNHFFFSGYRAATGSEPWISDGTPEGTRLLADLCPGPCSSNPKGFAGSEGRAIFLTLFESTTTVQVYENGEVRPLLILPGSADFAQLAGELYFTVAANGTNALYRSDGTPEGTRRVFTICSGPHCFPGGILGVKNDALYFARLSDLNHGSALYSILPGGSPTALAGFGEYSSSPSALVSIDADRVAFTAKPFDSANFEVWSSDGTEEGTLQIDDGTPATQTSNFHSSLGWRGQLYYRNAENVMVKTNGLPGGTLPAPELIGQDPVPLSANSEALFYQVWEGGLTYALRAQGSQGQNILLRTGESFIDPVGQLGELHFFEQDHYLLVSDGTAAGTKILPDLHVIGKGRVFGNRLVFVARPRAELSTQATLWLSDGTFAGTQKLEQGLTRPYSSGARPYRLGANLVADLSGAEAEQMLWRVDAGTFASSLADPRRLSALAGNGEVLFAEERTSHQLVALHPDTVETLPAPSPAPGFSLAADGTLFFIDSQASEKFWISDGSAQGTRELFDSVGCRSRNPCGGPRTLVPSGDLFYFASSPPQDSPRVFDLWVYGRLSNELRPLPPPEGATWTALPDQPMIALAGHRVAFLPGDGGSRTLWQTSGGPAPPTSIVELGAELSSWAVTQDHLFIATRNVLRVSDLTPEGTYSLLSPATLSVDELKRVGDHVFYRLQTSEQGSELGFSDGTPGGTSSLDLRPGLAGSFPRNFFAIDDQRVVFSASADDKGDELWISDGTPEGTSRLTDIAPGTAPSSPSDFALVGNRLFFQADDGTTGRELWALDLPPVRPTCPADRLCLLGGRFEVKVRAEAPDGTFEGRRAFGTSESGIFTFFTPNNWEFLVKVLDGCAINDQFWVYAAAATDVAFELEVTDRASGLTRNYSNAASQAARPILDSAAFATCEADPPAAQYPPAAPPAESARRCEDDLSELCLGNRFRVGVSWETGEESGKAHPVASGSADSGLFTFFSPSNWELMVKVLDGCALNGHHWVFAAGTTDVGWTLTVEDLASGETKVYDNVLGNASITLTDTEALGGCS